MSDRLDFLLSARLDDELTREERAELDALLAEHPESAARARAFEDVDTRIKSLAEQSAGTERLATTYDGLRARLGFDEPARSQGSTSVLEPSGSSSGSGLESGQGSSRGGASLLGRSVAPLLFAAAAAIFFYLVLPKGPPTTEEPSLIAASADRESEKDLAADLEDELVLALGYGDEMSEISGISSDDLDVVEQLDLLDFLSSRNLAVDEPEDRG